MNINFTSTGEYSYDDYYTTSYSSNIDDYDISSDIESIESLIEFNSTNEFAINSNVTNDNTIVNDIKNTTINNNIISDYIDNTISTNNNDIMTVLNYISSHEFPYNMEQYILFGDDTNNELVNARESMTKIYDNIGNVTFDQRMLYLINDQDIMFELMVKFIETINLQKWFFYICHRDFVNTVRRLLNETNLINVPMIFTTLNSFNVVYRIKYDMLNLLLEKIPEHSYVILSDHIGSFDYDCLELLIRSNKTNKDYIDKYVAKSKNRYNFVVLDTKGPIFSLIRNSTKEYIINKEKYYKKLELLINIPECDPSYDNNSYIHEAIKINDIKMVEIILNNPRINILSSLYHIMEYCSDMNKYAILKLIMDSDKVKNVKMSKNEQIKVLNNAVKNVTILKLLLDSNMFDPSLYHYSSKFKTLSNCLITAIRIDNDKAINMLLECKKERVYCVSPLMCDNAPIRMACKYGSVKAVKILLEFADVDLSINNNYCLKIVKKNIKKYKNKNEKKLKRYEKIYNMISKDKMITLKGKKKLINFKRSQSKYKIK